MYATPFALDKKKLGSLIRKGYDVWFNGKRWNVVERNAMILDFLILIVSNLNQ